MNKSRQINSKYYNTFMRAKKVLYEKYGDRLPKRLRFIITDEELRLLKSYKQFLEQILKNVDKILELFETNKLKEE